MIRHSPSPETDLNNQAEMPGESEGYQHTSSTLADPRRLRTGERGRPRLDPTQKGLVERRRNQVRKAQRAYRRRKGDEAALRTGRVADLEGRIHRMRLSFSELVSCISRAGYIDRQPELARELQDITRDFLSASQIVQPGSEAQHGPRDDRRLPNLPGSSNIYTLYGTESTLLPAPAAPGMRLPLPRNFAQRLYFSCIERAYHLLTSSYADKTEVARVFHYSFLYSDPRTMISTIDTLLRTNADYQTACVYKLGGAGTHYVKNQLEHGTQRPVPSYEQAPSECEVNTWFDPRDIEGWLEENGLVIGGAQSFMYLSTAGLFRLPDCPMPNGRDPAESLEDVRQGARILNVDQFLQELLLRGVCLGGAPGFRRSDVEASFSLAVSDERTFIRQP